MNEYNAWDAPEPIQDALDDLSESDDETRRFVIDSDEKAEWAIKKIRAAKEEHDRLISLIDREQNALDEKRGMIDLTYDRDTEYLKAMLNSYMRTVTVKSTKTQDSYQLLTAKLVRKRPALDYSVDNERLVKWLKDNGKGNLVNVKETPRWGELKKLLSGDAESGAVTIAETGEFIDGVEAVKTEEKFDIKFC